MAVPIKNIRNARITDVSLGREDHGIFTFFIYVEFGGTCCGVGGYALDEFDPETGARKFYAKSMEVISKILETVGVEKWEDLPGKYVRFVDNGWGSTIDEIGHIIDDKWFNLREFFNEEKECDAIKANPKPGDTERSCVTCKHFDDISAHRPCISCLANTYTGHPYSKWEGRI